MRKMHVLTALVALLLSVGIVNLGLAVDRYVDAVSGNNDNDGTEEHPWRTITYALNVVAASAGAAHPFVIHVAGGVYSTSTNGETFPLEMLSYVSLSGEGPNSTILNAQNAAYHLIYCHEVSDLYIEGFLMTGANANGSGEANTCGGGIWCDRSSPIIRHNIITGNSVQNSGGGMTIHFGAPIVFNNLIANNTAVYDGGGISGHDGEPIFANNTIVNNTAGRWGDGISLGTPDATMIDCILWGNGDENVSGFTDLEYCCTQEVLSGEGNIHLDPKFASGPLGDYYLDPLSPCINAGSKTAEEAGLSELTTQADETLDTVEVDMGYHHDISGTVPPPNDIIITSPPDFYFNTILVTWTPVDGADRYFFEYAIGGSVFSLEWHDTWLRLIAGDQAGWAGYVSLGTINYRVSALDALGTVINGPTEWATCTCY